MGWTRFLIRDISSQSRAKLGWKATNYRELMDQELALLIKRLNHGPVERRAINMDYASVNQKESQPGINNYRDYSRNSSGTRYHRQNEYQGPMRHRGERQNRPNFHKPGGRGAHKNAHRGHHENRDPNDTPSTSGRNGIPDSVKAQLFDKYLSR